LLLKTVVNCNVASASVSLHTFSFMALYKFVFNFNFNFISSSESAKTAISSQFNIEMCAAVENSKISLKPGILRVQGRSTPPILIPPESLSPVLVMISSKSVLTCNRFTLDEPLAVK